MPVAPSAASPTDPLLHFDLVILGTGSANSILGPEFDAWSVAIVEEGVFGGTCLNRGCIPTKMLVHTADVAETVRHASHLGVDATVDRIRWRDIRDRTFGRIDPIAAGGEEYRAERCPNVTVFKGRGSFIGERQIEVNGHRIEGKQVVVAVGARPHRPEIEGLDQVPWHTSDDIMRIDDLPDRLLVVGGGFIASELAHVFGSFGSKVTIIHRGDRFLKDQDDEVSLAFTDLVSRRPGFDVRLGVTPVAVKTMSSKAGTVIVLSLSDGSEVLGDALLIATGRVPNSDTVDARAGGLALHPDGRVVVDAHQRTSIPGVWALGDISSPHMLKHVANHEARVVQHNLLHPEDLRSTNHRFVPAAVFTRPQIASVGLTERAARAAGIDPLVKVQRYSDVAYGWAMEDVTGFVKLLADPVDRTLIGAHILGPSASTLIQQCIQGMVSGQTIDEMARNQYYIHPALPEIIENALLGLG